MNKKARTHKFTAKQSARLGAYLAAGVGASMASSSDAEAAIVFFDVNPDQTILGGNSLSFGNINLGTATYSLGNGTAPSFTLSTPGYGSGPTFSGTQIQAGAGYGYYIFRLSYGATISAIIPGQYSPEWTYGTGPGYWSSGDSGYIPLRMVLGGGNYNYGWAQVSVAGDGDSITITAFAFEDQVNTAILAGDQGGPAAVPEPGTWAAAALLAGGATFLRWRKRQAKVS